MDECLVRAAPPTLFFKDQIDEALRREQVPADELTRYYLVDLLCRFLRPDQRIPFIEDAGQPLALRLGRALESGGLEQHVRLRNLGDFSLFMAGFFSDSFRRRVVDIDYYISMGQYAYGFLGRREEDVFSEVFSELAGKFVPFMDVFTAVSEQSGLRTSQDVLRVYERWMRGSERAGRQLAERGIAPNPSIGQKFLQ